MPPNEVVARRPFLEADPNHGASAAAIGLWQQSASKIDRIEIRAMLIALTERKFTGTTSTHSHLPFIATLEFHLAENQRLTTVLWRHVRPTKWRMS
jgi:hypothetical protein